MPEAAPALVIAGSAKEPVILSGPPAQLSGQIELHNPGHTKVVLRDASLRDPAGALRLPPAHRMVAPVILRPDQGSRVTLTLAVDPATPPGEYHAELDIGGRTQPAILQVVEAFDLTVVPQSLVVFSRRAIAQRKRVIVMNTGNIAFTVTDPGAVELYDDTPGQRPVRVAIEPVLRSDEPAVDALLVPLLAVVRDDGAPKGSLDVRVRGGESEVRPGETKAVDLQIKVQRELPPGRRFRGSFPLLTRDLDVVVVPAGSGDRDAAPRGRRTRATETKRSEPRGGVRP